MAKKFYVVWQGRTPGIYTDWNSCKKQVEKFAGARYKSYPSRQEAEQAYVSSSSGSVSSSVKKGTAPKKRAPSKANTIKTYTAADIAKMNVDVMLFTDGGCDPNPGKAGSGMAVYRHAELAELWYGLYNPMGTNNTAELNALHQALMLAQIESDKGQSVTIFCDSKYSIQCVTQWAINWEKKGWKKAGGEIKNLELIKAMFALHQQLKDKIQVLHVNGHVGVEGNELADRMSILAIAQKDTDFCRYPEPLDIPAILSMRAG